MSKAARAIQAIAVLLLVTGCSIERAVENAAPDDTIVAAEPADTLTTSVETGETEDETDETPDVDDVAAEVPQTLDDVAVALDPIAEIDRPRAMALRTGVDEALYVAEQGGVIRRVTIRDVRRRVNSHRVEAAPVLDISKTVNSKGDGGLLGFTFSPDGRKLFVSYTDSSGATALDEYLMNVDDSQDFAVEDSQREVLRIEHREALNNGGHVAFGKDGYLYLAIGDGGGSASPGSHGQDRTSLLGGLLRIDPDGRSGTLPYGVPKTNPFVGTDDARPELWSIGLRNPRMFSFDPATDDLWMTDVGGNESHEITRIAAAGSGTARGANFGWNLFEGDVQVREIEAPAVDGDEAEADEVDASEVQPSDVEVLPPTFAYGHGRRCGIIGGYVYRGELIPELKGTYVYGDRCEAEVRGLIVTPEGQPVAEGELEAGLPGETLSAFGQDQQGELYVMSSGEEGALYRLVPAETYVLTDADGNPIVEDDDDTPNGEDGAG